MRRGIRMLRRDVPANDVHHASGEPGDSIELVAGDQGRCAGGDGLVHELIDKIATGGIESSVGFIEEPQDWPAAHKDRHRRSSTLTGRQTRDRHGSESSADTKSIHGWLNR